jgi:hypothetical protein
MEQEANVSDDTNDSYQLGTPVVPGSDNFTAANPPGCSNATNDFFIFLSGANVFPTPGCAFINSGGTFSIMNGTVLTFDFQFTPGVFVQNSATLAGAQSIHVTAQSVSISRGGTIIAVERASGTKTFQDVVICAGSSGSSC